MLGPVETDKYPEVAPVGIVKAIPVLLQTFIGISVPFIITMPFPSVAPKFVPLIATSVPTEPVVAE